MSAGHRNIQDLLRQMLSTAYDRGFSVTGNPDFGWILIRQAKLSRDFNNAETTVNIKFNQDRGSPNIAVLASIELRGDSKACPHFLQPAGQLDTWRRLCPYIFHDVGDDILELVTCLVGLLAEPRLCGLLGCEWNEGIQADPGIMQNNGNYSLNKVLDMPALE